MIKDHAAQHLTARWGQRKRKRKEINCDVDDDDDDADDDDADDDADDDDDDDEKSSLLWSLQMLPTFYFTCILTKLI